MHARGKHGARYEILRARQRDSVLDEVILDGQLQVRGDVLRGAADGDDRAARFGEAAQLRDRVLGGDSSELIAVLGLAMSRRTSLLRLSRMVFAYPTFAGAIGKVADEFARQTLGNLRGEVTTYARYRLVGRDHAADGARQTRPVHRCVG